MKVASNSRVDLLFRAFADRTRLRILFLLQDGEMCVGDLVNIIGLPQPRASRHLAYLRRAKLVVVRKVGLWCYYSLTPPQSEFHDKLLECLECCFADVPEIRADQARAKKLRKSGGCCPAERTSNGRKSTSSKCCEKPAGRRDRCP